LFVLAVGELGNIPKKLDEILMKVSFSIIIKKVLFGLFFSFFWL
jgi:hypothetical protein